MVAGRRVRLASRFSAFEDGRGEGFNTEGTEVGTRRARRECDCGECGDWDALKRSPTFKRPRLK